MTETSYTPQNASEQSSGTNNVTFYWPTDLSTSREDNSVLNSTSNVEDNVTTDRSRNSSAVTVNGLTPYMNNSTVVVLCVLISLVVLATIVVLLVLLYLRKYKKTFCVETFRSYTNYTEDEREEILDDDVFYTDEEDINNYSRSSIYSNNLNKATDKRHGAVTSESSTKTSNSTRNSNACESIQTTVLISPECHKDDNYVVFHSLEPTSPSSFYQISIGLDSDSDTRVDTSSLDSKVTSDDVSRISARCFVSAEEKVVQGEKNTDDELIELATFKNM